MVHNRRKKNSRQRGSWTHGYGEKKKHRGAGSRAGRGNAGSGKRADQKKPTVQNAGRKFGKNGFYHLKRQERAINVGYFDSANLEGKPGVVISKSAITIDLQVMGYEKLLGSGAVTGKYTIKALRASPSAIRKIEEAGGKVEVFAAEAEDVAEAAEAAAETAETVAEETEEAAEKAGEKAAEAAEAAEQAEEQAADLEAAAEAAEETAEAAEETAEQAEKVAEEAKK